MDHVYKKKTSLDEKRILKLFVSACRGLNVMHTLSTEPMAHNDVKVSRREEGGRQGGERGK